MRISNIIKNKSYIDNIFPYNLYDYQTINPINNKFIKKFDTLTNQQVLEKIRDSQLSFENYKETSLENRFIKMKQLAENFEKNIDKIANTLALEMGKPIRQGKSEVKKCIGHINYYIKHTEEYARFKIIDYDTYYNEVLFKPLGPILSINPFNFPFWVPLKSIIPAMMVGNTILLKPAPSIPQSSLLMEEMFRISGFNKNEFQIVMCSNDDIDNTLIPDIRIREVVFTGSSKIGSTVGALAGKYIKKSLLELGGNDPLFVLPDADLDKAAFYGAEGRLRNTGQACICSKRMFVHSSVYDKFIEKLIVEIEKYKIGNPLDTDTGLGPIARFDLFLKLKDQLIKTINLGANVVFGDIKDIDKEYHINDGNFFKAVILDNIPNNSPSYQEELFGPVFSIFKYDDLNEAIKIAHDTIYGLGASIFTKNISEAKRLAEKLDFGMVFINSSTISDSRLPYGGTKSSGYGRTSAYAAIQEFTTNKVIGVKK